MPSNRTVAHDPNLAIAVRRDHFSGGSHVPDVGPGSLADIVRGLAIDHARIKIETSNVSDPTNSVGGTDRRATLSLPTPAEFDASSSGGVTTASLTSSLNKIENSVASFADFLNGVNGRLGLPIFTYQTGSFVAGTIPALDASASSGSGASSPSQASVAAAFVVARNNLSTVLGGVNRIAAALGYTRLADNFGGSQYNDHNIRDVPALAASATGSDGVAKTAVDSWLANYRDNLTTMVAYVVRMFGTIAVVDLVDETSATAQSVYADVAVPASFTAGTNDAVAKAEFDLLFDEVAGNLAQFCTFLNNISERAGLPRLVDNSGGTANTGQEINNFDTSMTGTSTGGSLVNATDAVAWFERQKRNAWRISNRVNELAPFFGVKPLANNIDLDGVGGDMTQDEEVNIEDAATITGAASTTTSVSKAAADAFLTWYEQLMATWVVQANLFTGSTLQSRSLHVVAAD